jgi:hypothetical protein
MANPTKITWTAPTLNTDGSAIAAGEITGFNIGVRAATGVLGTYAYTGTVSTPTATSELLSALSPQPPYGVSLIAAVQTVGPTDSAWGESGPFTLSAPVPAVPTAVSVT